MIVPNSKNFYWRKNGKDQLHIMHEWEDPQSILSPWPEDRQMQCYACEREAKYIMQYRYNNHANTWGHHGDDQMWLACNPREHGWDGAFGYSHFLIPRVPRKLIISARIYGQK